MRDQSLTSLRPAFVSSLPLRLTGLALLVIGAATLIGWLAFTNWRRFGELHEGLQLAQRLEEQLIELQSEINRLALVPGAAGLERIQQRSRGLEQWLAGELAESHSSRQRRMLERTAVAFAAYLVRLDELTVGRDSEGAGRLAAIVALDERLLGIMRESLAEFLGEVQQGLVLRQALTFALLAVLLALLGWIAVAVYRGMIAPLQHRLIEAGAEIEQSRKLAALGVLAAGIAHEIRNPLTAIKARLFTHQRALAKGTPAYENTAVIGRELDRLERIVREFLTFARPADPVRAEVRSTEVLREVAELLGGELVRRSIDLRVEEQPELRLWVDRQHILQLMINLVRNAADSIERDGRIVLRTLRGRASLGGVLREVAILEVEDNGKGIPPVAQPHLFDPFFSTKPNGTGLGLAIAARIAEKHGGALRFRTEINRGTTFGLVLPLEGVQ